MEDEVFKCFDCFQNYKFHDDKTNTMCNIDLPKNICLACLNNYFTKKDHLFNNNAFKNIDSVYQEKYDLLANKLENKIKSSEEEIQIDKDIYLLKKDLEQLSNESAENEQTLINLIQEYMSLLKTEETFWNDFNILERSLYLLEKKQTLISNQSKTIKQEIKNCSSANIFGDLFIISFSDKLGTINGCRMGDETNSNNYDEVNAGWGYIIFLTRILSCKFGFESNKYILKPRGNYSKIKTKSNQKKYELSLSDNSRTLEKFNEGMKAFLDYIKEFYDYLVVNKKILSKKSDFDFKIMNDCINNKSIILGQSKPEDWAQCIKYLLTFLKYLITQVLKGEDDEYKKIIEKASLIYTVNTINKK